MKKTRRSAFTIVELVIVIAVIAILSAVLIPTFGMIIRDANEAADNTTAATLTSELHVHLKGEQIDSEEELMDVLEDSGIGEKLVPKALAWGNHFWFDIANQRFIAATADEVSTYEPSEQALVQPTEGPALMAAVTVAARNSSALAGMRDIYQNGYFLVDSDETLETMFGSMSQITKGNYATFIANLGSATSDDIYGPIAEKVLEDFEKTIIFNENGTFYYSTNTTDAHIYFAEGLKVISATHYVYEGGTVTTKTNAKLPTPGVEFVLPSSVVLVQPNALDFADASVQIKLNTTVGTDYEKITSIFAPKSTNVVIVDLEGRQFNVTVADGTTHKDGETVIEAGTDILVANGAFVAYLTPKAPFETKDDWDIGYELTTDEQLANKDNWLLVRPDGVDGSDVLYLNIASAVDFYIVGKDGTISYSVKEWKSNNESVITNDLQLVGAGSATLTATVVHLDGHEDTHEVNIVVNAAEEANIKIMNSYYKLDGGTYDVNWTYTKGAELTPVENGIQFVDDLAFAKGSNDITVTIVDAANASLKAVGNKLTKIDGKTADATIKITVDGELETTFVVSIIDNSNSPIEVNFYDKTNSDVYRYYIGDKNAVTLGALFDIKSLVADFDLAGAKLIVYDIIDGDGVLQEANNGNPGSGVVVDFSGSNWTLGAEWEKETLSFTREGDYIDDSEGFDVYIKITPADGKTPIFVRVHIVDGWNIEYKTDAAGKDVTLGELESKLANYNAVLHSNLTMVTGQTLTIEGKTLYGNGYVIDADKYIAETHAHTNTVQGCTSCGTILSECEPGIGLDKGYHWTNWKKTSYIGNIEIAYSHYETNVSMIQLNDGTINNVYINGPVYDKLQYMGSDCPVAGYNDASTGYYVSGIKTEGVSVIINSYVSGFRQPVQAAGDVLNLTNTTLRGGNYANLMLAAGNLNLTDVTTIQDQGGQKATVGDTSKKIVGMGIAIEKTDLSAEITIDGYLNQYNWVKEKSGANLPVIKSPVINNDSNSLDANTLFGYLFEGVNVLIGNVEVGSVKAFIHKDYNNLESVETKCDNNYVNAGIVFIDVGSGEYIDGVASQVNIKIKNGANREAGVMSSTTLKTMNFRFKDAGYESINATSILGTDGLFYIWGYQDGRAWVRNGLGVDLVSGSVPTVVLDPSTTETPKGESGASEAVKALGDITYVPVVYRGYYDNLGAYTSKYVILDANKIIPDAQ